MVYNVLAASTFENVLELIALVVVFILILIAAYYCTRFIGKYSYNQYHSANIEVIETFNLSQAKYIQIVRIGNNRYVAIAVCKDTVEKLADLSEDDIVFVKKENNIDESVFADILSRIRKKTK